MKLAPNDDKDFELTGVLSPEERVAKSMKRAERDGDVIDLCDLADDSVKQHDHCDPYLAASFNQPLHAPWYHLE